MGRNADSLFGGINYMEIHQGNFEIFNETIFNDQKMKLLISSLDRLELIYRLKSQPTPQTELLPHYTWVIKQSFSFENRNHLTLRLHLSKQIIPAPYLPYTQYVWLDFVVVVLSIGSLLLTFKYIYEVAFLYNDDLVKSNRDKYKAAYVVR